MNKRRNLFLICLFAVLLGSCNFNSVEINEPLLKLDAVIVNDKISRTALPTYSASELTDIVFSSRITGETEYGILQEWNSFSEMQDSKLKMKSGTYDFKLEGKIGCNEFAGEILSCVIDKVESRLTVELSLTNSFIGEGEIQISLSYPASSVELGIPEVKEVTVELLDFERTNVVEEENALEISENTVKYNSGKKYADGNYWVVFRLYADENRKLLLNEKTELAVVKDAGISKSSLKFENLDKIYTVTCYDGTEVLKTFEYTKRSGIKFVNEDFQKEGYALVGLYETSDFTGTAVEEYQVGTTGNKILFTNWEMGVSYTVEVYLQSLDCENYEYDTTLKTLWAKNGDVISSYADNISYEGYQLQTIEPITLDATSESNVLKLKFNRKTVTITLKKDANTEYKVLSGPYGTNIESFDVPESDSENLIFVGWTKDDVDIILETYPIEDCVYIAKWIDCSITSFTAKASSIGVNYTGVIPVEIIGTNLDDIYQLFKWEGGIPTNFISISDKKITAEVELHDYTTGEKSLKISCGSLTASTTVTVLSEDESFSVGDILFSDGTKIKAEDIQYGITEEQKAKAIAVITSTKYDGGVGIGVGIQRSSSTLAWAPNLTTGRNKNFTGIYGTTTSGDMDGSDNWEYICSQDSNGIQNASTNYPAFNFANNYGTTAGLTETDYAEGWYVPSAAELYNITCTYRTKIQSSLDAVSGFTIGSTDYWSSSQSSYTSDALVVYNSGYFSTSKSNNYYVLAVKDFSYNTFSKYTDYIEPTITSISTEVSSIGEGYKDSIAVTITGENFNSPLRNDIMLSGGTFGKIVYVDATTLKTTVSFDGTVGENTVTATYGNSSVSTTVNIVATDSCFAIGDIIYADGKRIKSENVQYGRQDGQSQAIAVITSTKYDGGVGIGVGIQRSPSTLAWAPSGTTGYNTNFTGIYGTTTSRDMDGSDNWKYICSQDPSGILNASTNYPAFNFANTYAAVAGLSGTDYAKGWYVPSIAELSNIFTLKTTIQKSLDIVGGFTIGTDSYWSSSQADYYDNYYAYSINRYNYSRTYKDSSINVLVVKSFNCDDFQDYVYEEPVIEKITAETNAICETYTNQISLTIQGINLDTPDVQNIVFEGGTFDTLEYVNETTVKIKVSLDGIPGTKVISATYGTTTLSTSIEILTYGESFSVGDILFSDGTKIKAENVQYGITEEQKAKAIAVITSTKYDGGVGIGVGIQRSSSTLEWAPSGTTGYNTDFTGIYGTTTSGDMDGSDNWEYICSQDPSGIQNASTNYPAFNFANNYGTTAGLTETDYSEGWYVPSAAELYNITYTYKSKIQSSLDAVSGFTIGNTIEYWSSSQSSSTYSALELDGNSSSVYSYSKSYSFYVLAVRKF